MSKNIKQYVPIFIASTYTDFIPYRTAVWRVVEKLSLAVSGMEVFGARTATPLETCVQEVKKCEIFIGIVGMRFGSIDPQTRKSYVQIEYETALEKGIDILVYLLDEENASIPPKYVDTDERAARLRDFKERLFKKHTVELFGSPNDLAKKVERDLLRLFDEKKILIGENKLQIQKSPEKTREILEKFSLVPGKFKGSEVELKLRFNGPPSSVLESTCKALKLPYGNSLRRSIEVIEPPDVEGNFFFLDYLYAEYDGCDFLLDTPDSTEETVRCRLEFGKSERIIRESSFETFSPDEIFLPKSQGVSVSINRNYGIKDLESGVLIRNYLEPYYEKALVFVKKSKQK
jgi:hypothetical protein